jgi:hypothetical protein
VSVRVGEESRGDGQQFGGLTGSIGNFIVLSRYGIRQSNRYAKARVGCPARASVAQAASAWRTQRRGFFPVVSF